jgi:hypothetical protein
MGFVWGALAVGDKVLYSPAVQLDEMRDNADWLDDNLANVTYNGTVDATADLGYDATLLSGQLNGQNTTVNSGYNAAYCACNSK